MEKEVIYKECFKGIDDSIDLKYDLTDDDFTVSDSDSDIIMNLEFAKGLSKALAKFINDIEKDLKK